MTTLEALFRRKSVLRSIFKLSRNRKRQVNWIICYKNYFFHPIIISLWKKNYERMLIHFAILMLIKSPNECAARIVWAKCNLILIWDAPSVRSFRLIFIFIVRRARKCNELLIIVKVLLMHNGNCLKEI